MCVCVLPGSQPGQTKVTLWDVNRRSWCSRELTFAQQPVLPWQPGCGRRGTPLFLISISVLSCAEWGGDSRQAVHLLGHVTQRRFGGPFCFVSQMMERLQICLRQRIDGVLPNLLDLLHGFIRVSKLPSSSLRKAPMESRASEFWKRAAGGTRESCSKSLRCGP